MRKNLTVKSLAALPPADAGKRYELFDVVVPQMGVRVTAKGKKSFFLLARFPGSNNPTRRSIGSSARVDLAKAREIAREWLEEIDAGIDPAEKNEGGNGSSDDQTAAQTDKFETVAEAFLEKYVHSNKRRSASETERIIAKELLPKFGSMAFVDIGRSDISVLLDDIARRGPVQADRTLSVISKMCNWYATRSDDYTSPIVPGMKRTDPAARKRSRILSDNEIRWLWSSADSQGIFGMFVQMALLTAQRRAKLLAMRWQDVNSQGVWNIPVEPREKANAGSLQLSAQALLILENLRNLRQGEFVFTLDGKKPINGISKAKARLDAAMLSAANTEIPSWTIHDLRRTAKTLMARAGVEPHISERVLGHVISDVEGVYDQYDYGPQKADALARLGQLIDEIVKA